MNEALKKSGRMLIPALALLALVIAVAVAQSRSGFSRRERMIIQRSDSLMYVLVMPQDSTVLRTPSVDLGEKELSSAQLQTLLDKMLYTVQHPSQDGVGIAAPQVGINRRIICVQRLDKPGEPFECYLNIRVDSLAGECVRGPEGCLSVPPMRGMVTRRSTACISYLVPGSRERKAERVEGYTAIIFQHECDHLDGILYTDRADSVFVSEAWAKEREAYSYERPAWE